MIAVQIADYFVLKSHPSDKSFDIRNIIIWIIGFVLYRYFMGLDIVVGNTLPDMLVVIVICVVSGKLLGNK